MSNKEYFKSIEEVYSSGKRFDEMETYKNRKLKIWEKEVIALFPLKAKVLNIGCGKGREAFCLYDKGFFVTGVDISEKIIGEAKQISSDLQLEIDFHVSDGLNLPFSDASFDVTIIWSQTFGLFHRREDKTHILNECRRVLTNPGLLSFSVHDRDYVSANYPTHIKNDFFIPFDTSNLSYQMYTKRELATCVKAAGFQLVNIKDGMVYKKEDGTILYCLCRK